MKSTFGCANVAVNAGAEIAGEPTLGMGGGGAANAGGGGGVLLDEVFDPSPERMRVNSPGGTATAGPGGGIVGPCAGVAGFAVERTCVKLPPADAASEPPGAEEPSDRDAPVDVISAGSFDGGAVGRARARSCSRR